MHPKSILNVVPPEELNGVISSGDYKTLNLFVDFKNVANSLFIDDVVQEIVHNSSLTGYVDSNIFQSTIFLASQWKHFANNKNLKFNIFFCYDNGRSEYHYNIYDKYKINRLIGTVDLPSYYDELTSIKRQNVELCDIVCNRIPNVYFINLHCLESDFVPYYLITRELYDNNNLNIVLSNDKDLFQCLTCDNTFLLYKKSGIVKMFDKSSVFKKYIKLNNMSESNKIKKINMLSKLDASYYPAVMAIVGDKSDNIPGIKGIGEIRAVEAFSLIDTVKEVIGDYNELVKRIISGGNYVSDIGVSECDDLPGIWKRILENNNIVTTGFKLISFEVLCQYLEKKSDMYSVRQLKKIYETVHRSNENDIVNENALFESLKTLNDSVIELEDLKILFE